VPIGTGEASIRQALVNHAIRNEGTDTLARSIKDVIGLSPAQAQHVANYRVELELMHPNAMQRALRDRRYDAGFQKALADKTPLDPERIDKMVDAYHRRWIAYRADTIARTEGLRAATTGAVESTRAALADSPTMTVVKTWIATKDDRTRDTHRHLDGQSVTGMETPFVTTAGNTIRWPHDENAPASETINCRCTIGFRLLPPTTQPYASPVESEA
jgi:hypothetical protein